MKKWEVLLYIVTGLVACIMVVLLVTFVAVVSSNLRAENAPPCECVCCEEVEP